MQIRSKLFVLAAVSAIAMATSALADNQAAEEKIEKKNVAVFINKDGDNSDAKVKLKINGENWKFELPKLSDGEERIIATEDGRTVKAKRSGKEVTVEAGGETIKLPAEGHGMHVRFHGVPPVPPTPPVPGVPPMPAAEIEALRNSVVISGVELSEVQQQKVRDAIKKAGIDKPVKFVQGGRTMIMHGHGPMTWHEKSDGKAVHKVMVISTDDGEVLTEDLKGDDDIQIEQDIEVIRKTDKKDSN